MRRAPLPSETSENLIGKLWRQWSTTWCSCLPNPLLKWENETTVCLIDQTINMMWVAGRNEVWWRSMLPLHRPHSCCSTLLVLAMMEAKFSHKPRRIYLLTIWRQPYFLWYIFIFTFTTGLAYWVISPFFIVTRSAWRTLGSSNDPKHTQNIS